MKNRKMRIAVYNLFYNALFVIACNDHITTEL